MFLSARASGFTPEIPSPAERPEIVDVATEESAVVAPGRAALHITPLVKEGDVVARGAAVASLRHAPGIRLVAPIAGRVARISLLPGRKLSEIVLFREPGDDVERHRTDEAATAPGLRRLMLATGVWPWLRRRPFGGMPAEDEVPAAVTVMATDTRPLAPDPGRALRGLEDEFARGLGALARLTEGPVFVVTGDRWTPPGLERGGDQVRIVRVGPQHPQGSPGMCIHRLFPAGIDAPVWDIGAEDVAALGALLATGELPMTRLVRIAGPALREARSVRTHQGADLRALTQRIVAPGPHMLLSGSPLDGHPAQWLMPRHRQVTVMPRGVSPSRPHWLLAALTRSATGVPAIPTAALGHAFAQTLPAGPFVRAVAAGDEETAIKLGILSLLEEDVALADYVLNESGLLMARLRAMLDRIQAEYAA